MQKCIAYDPLNPALRRHALRVLAVTLILFCSSEARAVRHIAVIGNSTEWGSLGSGGKSWTHPAAALEALLRIAPAGNPWRRARVYNLAIPASTSTHWVELFEPAFCSFLGSNFNRVMEVACSLNLPFAYAVLPAYNGRIDAVLAVLGTNDLPLPNGDPSEVVDRLAMLPAILAPAATFLSPPFPSTLEPRKSLIPLVRLEMLERGLLSGPDWPPLPVPDGLHLSQGGYAAAAGLWLDALLGTLVTTTTESTSTTTESTSTTTESTSTTTESTTATTESMTTTTESTTTTTESTTTTLP
jgi:hypothetical protein